MVAPEPGELADGQRRAEPAAMPIGAAALQLRVHLGHFPKPTVHLMSVPRVVEHGVLLGRHRTRAVSPCDRVPEDAVT
ncbi:MAG: hypothetical protein ACRDOI_36955 [Trebonia sp.]